MLSCLAPLRDCGGFPPLGGLPGWADTQDIFEVEWSTMFFSCVYIFLLGWTPLAQVGWSSGVTLVWSNRSLWLVSPCSCLCPGHADLLLHARNPHQWDFFLVSRQRKDGFCPRRRDTRFWSRRWDTGSWDTCSPFWNCIQGRVWWHPVACHSCWHLVHLFIVLRVCCQVWGPRWGDLVYLLPDGLNYSYRSHYRCSKFRKVIQNL